MPSFESRFFVVSGCSGTGKSTLVAELARLGLAVFPEPGRQVLREELAVGGTRLPWTDVVGFAERCIWRAMWFHSAAVVTEGSVIFDRSIVDAVTAIERVGCLRTWHKEVISAYRYASKVFLFPPWEALFETDAERRHGFAEAVAEYDALAESYPTKGYEVVLVPRGDVLTRADFVEGVLSDA